MIYLLFFIGLSYFSAVSCRSFTLVIDTTASMRDELKEIKDNFPSLKDLLSKSPDLDSFIVVPFNDPGVGNPIETTNVDSLSQSINALSVSGGEDCPENSLAGIQKALEVSKQESFIYLFTDATAKYSDTFGRISNLCSSSRSKVVIFLSRSGSGGACPAQGNRGQDDVSIYYNIAKYCGGAVFRMDDYNLRKGFKYIKEMIQNDWDEVIDYDYVSYGSKEFSFSVDSFTKDAIIVISGEFPTLQITDKDNRSPAVQKIVDTRHSLVVRILDPVAGWYNAGVKAEGSMYTTVFLKNQIPFDYGFSTRFVKSLRETSMRPMPGWTNYILIVLKENFNVQISTLELEIIGTNENKTLRPEAIEACDGYYSGSVLVEPNKPFKMTITGRDTYTYEDISVSTKVIEPQDNAGHDGRWLTPSVEILEPEKSLIDFGTSTEIACIVKGYPKPTIWWMNDLMRENMTSQDYNLELPSTFISYVKIENMTANFTLQCLAKNAAGEGSQALSLYVNRTFTFDVISTPNDQSIAFESGGRLYCKVDAFPEVQQTKWYQNDTLIYSFGNKEIIPDENVLIIKQMTLDDVGKYACNVDNGVRNETFYAEITISGLEAPQVEVELAEIILKLGDWKDIECRVVKGTPTPQITWKYSQDGFFFDSLPLEVVVDDNKLKIAEVKKEHKGTYRCIASNLIGEASIDVDVKIKYAPKVSIGQETSLTYTEEDMVELKCSVDAIPSAKVEWQKDGRAVGVWHSVDEEHTHRFIARSEDTGNYLCKAENELGSDQKSVYIDVLVPPFIEKPMHENITALLGSSISLPCRVIYAHPEATTWWMFIPENSAPVKYPSGNSTNILHLQNISKNDEGTYVCLAENKKGFCRISINVKVQSI